LARVSMIRPNSIGSANNAAASKRLAIGQDPAEPSLRAEHLQDADIEADKIHLTPSEHRIQPETLSYRRN
jgi:hypothetical protein